MRKDFLPCTEHSYSATEMAQETGSPAPSKAAPKLPGYDTARNRKHAGTAAGRESPPRVCELQP